MEMGQMEADPKSGLGRIETRPMFNSGIGINDIQVGAIGDLRDSN